VQTISITSAAPREGSPISYNSREIAFKNHKILMVRLVTSGTWQFWDNAPFPPKASRRAHTYLKTSQEKQFCHQRGNTDCWKRASNTSYSRGKWERADPDASLHLTVPWSSNLVSGLCITTGSHEARLMKSLWPGKTIVRSTALVPDLHNTLQTY